MAEGKITEFDNSAVEIDGNWYQFGEKINPKFIRVGECEYSVDQDGEIVNFIRMKKSERKFGKSSSRPIFKKEEKSQFRDPNQILKQECLNVAKDIAIANKGDKPITAKEVIGLTLIFQEYVQFYELEKE